MLSKAADFFINAANRNLSRLSKLGTGNFLKGGGGAINAGVLGTLYLPSFSIELSVFKALKDRRNKSISFWDTKPYGDSVINNSSTTSLPFIEDDSIDYIFVDPPFGANINYSDLNFLWEGWFDVFTCQDHEAIQNSHQRKSLDDYRGIMSNAFKELYRVLKPGRWMTVEFSNTKASVWNSIQTSLQEAGFIVGNVSALDKKLGSFKAVTTTTAVKQDLVISAYKPTVKFDSILQGCDKLDEKILWEFMCSHLNFLPIVKLQDGVLTKIPERDPRILFDQAVSWCIRNGLKVPLSSQEFQSKLGEKFSERDGMFFLPEQILAYDKKRVESKGIFQQSIFVDDEASAIDWMRQELKEKPKTYSEIHPLFLNELSGWKKNELELELFTLLEQNFIKYDGVDEVPSQIHTYLSTNFKDMRGLEKNDPKLKAKAKDRWYVPDPNKAADLEKVRLRALLKEFESYKAEKKKIKQPRAEALRAGFNAAWEAQDFQTILDVSAKIPTDVLQEDEKLLMFYDNALTLTTSEDDEW
ncbi:site-specific DNA-methyltransferase [Vibrio vulnificus]